MSKLAILSNTLRVLVALAVAGIFSTKAPALAQVPEGYSRAQAAYDEGNFGTAIDILADHTDELSQTLLGYAYLKRNSSQDDIDAAMEAFRNAAKHGSASAQFFLGTVFHNGQYGFPQDYVEASKWALAAARQGVAESQSQVGYYFSEGLGGLSKNLPVAVCWFRNAANQGEVGAQYNIGRAISIGEGVPQDYVEAYKWLNLAAAQGLDKAVTLRDALRPLLSSEQLTEAQRASTNWRSHRHIFGERVEACS